MAPVLAELFGAGSLTVLPLPRYRSRPFERDSPVLVAHSLTLFAAALFEIGGA